MEKKTVGIIAALLFLFSCILFLGQPTGMTGFTIADRFSSFFVRNSLSALGPITVLSLIFGTSVVFLIEVRKK